jgi:hypothetical protein
MDLDAAKGRLADIHRGRKWILTPDAAAAAGSLVEQLHGWESGPIMIVSAIEGVGEVPEVERVHYTRTGGDTIIGNIRAFLDSIEEPSATLRAAVDAFDPEGEAMNLAAGFSRKPELAGRPIYGKRPADWGALEDKMLIDELCDAAGIARAPSAIVPVAEASAAADRLAGELGTVWVADNTEGWHGGGEYVRWVRGPDDIPPAQQWFSEHAASVRVMPFLDGIPCSIHGFNTRDGTAVFLPVEMLIFRHTERPEFVYGRAANYWDPPPQITGQMRDAGSRMGALLADRVGYLGGFGIDGVATKDGFLPTELNPRQSVGHAIQASRADLALGSLERAIIAGDLDVAATDLEETTVAAARATRGGGMLIPIEGDHEAAETGLVFTDSGAEAVAIEHPSDARMRIGPGGLASVIIVRFDPEWDEVGPSVAPRVLQTLPLAERLWDVKVPPLEAAPDPFSERSL